MHLNVLIASCIIAAASLVLDNGAVRVEVDPSLFSVRFIGMPGGTNFLEPLFVNETGRRGKDWLDPGGLVTDLIPCEARDAALRRGPAEVVVHDGQSLVLIGPPSEQMPLRLKKEIRLMGTEARVVFRVTVLSTSPEPLPLALRNTARLPHGVTLHVNKSDATIRSLADTDSIFPAVVKSSRYWLIPVPPAGPVDHVLLGAFVPELACQGNGGTWIRRIENMPADGQTVPQESTFLCILDNETRSYGAALQCARVPVDAGRPLVFTEEWTFEKRGK